MEAIRLGSLLWPNNICIAKTNDAKRAYTSAKEQMRPFELNPGMQRKIVDDYASNFGRQFWRISDATDADHTDEEGLLLGQWKPSGLDLYRGRITNA